MIQKKKMGFWVFQKFWTFFPREAVNQSNLLHPRSLTVFRSAWVTAGPAPCYFYIQAQQWAGNFYVYLHSTGVVFYFFGWLITLNWLRDFHNSHLDVALYRGGGSICYTCVGLILPILQQVLYSLRTVFISSESTNTSFEMSHTLNTSFRLHLFYSSEATYTK